MGALVVVIAAGTVPPAFAQAARVGATFLVKPLVQGEVTRFPAVAYDAANDAYLVVWGLQKHGARFVSADGVPLGAPTRLHTADGGAVRVACGAEINACLVAWIQEPRSIVGRLVRYNGGNVQFLTAPFAISSNGLLKLTSAPPSVAYSSASNEFLVAWTDISGVDDVRAQRVSASGALAGAPIDVAATPAWEGFPSLAYNSARDEFIVSYYLETIGVPSGVGIKRIQPGTGAVLSNSVLHASLFEQYPEIAYNSRLDQYLAITWGFAGRRWMLHGQLADGAGQPVGPVLSLAANGGGDGIGVAYNPVTNSYFAVYLNSGDNEPEIWGVAISSSGVPGTQFRVTQSGTKLATKPQIAGSKANTRFLAVASENFGQAMAQLVEDGVPAPTPAPSPAPLPTPATPLPRMNVDTPAAGARVPSSGFIVAGWAIDAAATGTPGVDVVDVWAYPAGASAAVFVGTAAYGTARPDISAAFSKTHFGDSGFLLNATLAPGTYDLAVFARSTVAGTFNNMQLVRVTVEAPVSAPRMWVDTPSQNQDLSQNVRVAGWALDLGATAGSGVDAVHVWAYPTDGASPILLGVADIGHSRPDVAGAFGSARYTNSGFNVQGTLPRGTYTLVVFAHSSVVNAFNNVFVIPVRVN